VRDVITLAVQRRPGFLRPMLFDSVLPILLDLYSDVHKSIAKQDVVTFLFTNLCWQQRAWGGLRHVGGKGGTIS